MKIIIYGLINPITSKLFYIGATKNIKSRVGGHIHGRQSNRLKRDEIESIINLGEKPEILILDECDISEVQFYENFYMDLFKSYGFTLLQNKKSNYAKKISFRLPNFSKIQKDNYCEIKYTGIFMGIECEVVDSVTEKDNISEKINSLYNKYLEQIDSILLMNNSPLVRVNLSLTKKPS